MKLKSLASLCIVLVATLLVVPSTASAGTSSAHGPDFQKMMAVINELKQKTGQDFDVTYINSIVQHHLDAITMAKAVQNDAPLKAVRDAATKIIEDQQREIDEVTKEMNETYKQQVMPDARMKMSQSMMDMMMQADPTMREKLFLGMMREHHEAAMMMGNLVLQKTSNAKLREQAQTMVTTQKQEQDTFGGYLQGVHNITPPTPTGDMQHGMEAVMSMPGMSGSTPAAGTSAPPAAQPVPAALPSTGGENVPWWPAVAGLFILLLGGYVVRRNA